MALPTSDIRPRSGMKGKAVHIIHVYEDFLWSMGDKSEPPEMQDISDDEYEEEGDGENNEAVNKEEAPVATEAEGAKEVKEQEESNIKHLSTNGKLDLTGNC
jgi:translation initiation factor 2D